MKKIKLLTIIMIFFTVLYSIHFISLFFLYDIYGIKESFLPKSLIDKVAFISVYLNEVILFTSLLFFSTGLLKIISQGYYNPISFKVIKKGGILAIISSLLDLLYVISSIGSDNDFAWINRLSSDILLLILGIGSLIISDILKKNIAIKTENDLTI